VVRKHFYAFCRTFEIKKETGFGAFVELVILSILSLGIYFGWWTWSSRQRQTLLLSEILNHLEEMKQDESSPENHPSED